MMKRERSIRVSVSFSPADVAELKRLAEEMRVSLAWVVRDAVSRYIGDELRVEEPCQLREESPHARP